MNPQDNPSTVVHHPTLKLPAGLPREPGNAERRVAVRRRGDDGQSRASLPVTDTQLTFRVAKARAVEHFEREYVAAMLCRSRGNVSLAARLAGKERSRFNRLVRKYQLSPRDFREPRGSPETTPG
jgi:DNA-binding NtrC family response regulator